MVKKVSWISARVTKDMEAKLRAHCSANDVPRSYVIERALEEYLNHPESHGPARLMRDELAGELADAGQPGWHDPEFRRVWEQLEVLSDGAERALEVTSAAAAACAHGECHGRLDGPIMKP